MINLSADRNTIKKRVSFLDKAFDARTTYILSLLRMAMESGFTQEEAIWEIQLYTELPEDIIRMCITSDFSFDF